MGGGVAFGAAHILAFLLIVRGWWTVPPPRLAAVLVLAALLASPFVLWMLLRQGRQVLSRVVGTLAVASLVAVVVTMVSVARHSFSACQALNPFDAVVETSRGYDLLSDEVLCRYDTRDGRVAERRVRSWTVLTEYGAD